MAPRLSLAPPVTSPRPCSRRRRDAWGLALALGSGLAAGCGGEPVVRLQVQVEGLSTAVGGAFGRGSVEVNVFFACSPDAGRCPPVRGSDAGLRAGEIVGRSTFWDDHGDPFSFHVRVPPADYTTARVEVRAPISDCPGGLRWVVVASGSARVVTPAPVTIPVVRVPPECDGGMMR